MPTEIQSNSIARERAPTRRHGPARQAHRV